MEKSLKIVVEIHNWKELASQQVGTFGGAKLWIAKNLLRMDIQTEVEKVVGEAVSQELDELGAHYSIHIWDNEYSKATDDDVKEEDVQADEQGLFGKACDVVAWPVWKVGELGYDAFTFVKSKVTKPVREIEVHASEMAIIPDEQ